MPKAVPDESNACGIARATMRNPAMPTSIKRRATTPRGGTALVSHAYPPYIHHTLPKMTTNRATPTAFGWATRRLVSWVMVNTNTRSKNNSIVETRDPSMSAPECELPGAFDHADRELVQ